MRQQIGEVSFLVCLSSPRWKRKEKEKKNYVGSETTPYID